GSGRADRYAGDGHLPGLPNDQCVFRREPGQPFRGGNGAASSGEKENSRSRAGARAEGGPRQPCGGLDRPNRNPGQFLSPAGHRASGKRVDGDRQVRRGRGGGGRGGARSPLAGGISVSPGKIVANGTGLVQRDPVLSGGRTRIPERASVAAPFFFPYFHP